MDQAAAFDKFMDIVGDKTANDEFTYRAGMQSLIEENSDVIKSFLDGLMDAEQVFAAVKNSMVENYAYDTLKPSYDDYDVEYTNDQLLDDAKRILERDTQWGMQAFEDSFINALNDENIKTALSGLVTTFDQGSEKIAEGFEHAYQAFYGDNKDKFNTGSEAGNRIAYADYEAEVAKRTKIIEAQIRSDAQNDDTTETSRDIWKRYLAAEGKTDLEWIAENNQVQKNKNNREYAYRVAGSDETKYVDAHTMAASIAAYEALRDFNQSNQVATDLLNNLKLNINNPQQFAGVQEWLGNKTFSSTSLGTLASLQSSDFNFDEAFGLTGKTLDEQNAIAAKYGFDSAVEFKTAFAKGLEQANAGIKQLNIDQLLADAGLSGSDIVKFTNNLSLTTATHFKDVLQNLNLGPEGKKVGNEFIQNMNSVLDKVDEKDRETFLEKKLNIDWSKTDAIDKLKELFKDFGIDENSLNIDWNASIA